MLETIDDVYRDRVSRNILNLLAAGWMPIKVLISKLGVDRHTAYRRFEALEKLILISKSKRKHRTSRYRVLGFKLTESGKIVVPKDRTAPSMSLKFPMHAFEQNYMIDAKLYWYPTSEAPVFNPTAGRYRLHRGIANMLLELWRDPNINLANYRLIFDCKFEALAELDIHEFYRDCLSPSLDSYVKNRTFSTEKGLATRISGSSDYALNLIKLTRFTATNYSEAMGKENAELINAALDTATKEVENKKSGWAHRFSSLAINVYLFMLASIYHSEGKLPEPESYFELWYTGIDNLKKLKRLFVPLLRDLKKKVA